MQRFVTPENRKWWTLGAVSFGLFMIMLDNTVVNVALPAMQQSLGLQLSELEWVVAGYALTFGAFMLTGGKLADLFGRRLIFVVGLAIFTPRRSPAGFAPSGGFLIGARVVQGLGAALMNPATLSIITVDLPAAAARHGDRHLGRRLGARARDRPARRRPDHRARQLELDLLHQRPDRDRSRSLPRSALHRRVARHLARAAARRARPGHVRDRPVRAHLRADRGEQLRLELAAHPRLVRDRRRRARRRSSCSSGTSGCRCSTSRCSATARSPARTR